MRSAATRSRRSISCTALREIERLHHRRRPRRRPIARPCRDRGRARARRSPARPTSARCDWICSLTPHHSWTSTTPRPSGSSACQHSVVTAAKRHSLRHAPSGAYTARDVRTERRARAQVRRRARSRSQRSSMRRSTSIGACSRTTSRARSRTPRCSPRRASSPPADATAIVDGLRRVEAQLAAGELAVGRRARGRPHERRGAADRRDRRRRPAPAHRRAAATIRSRPTCGSTRAPRPSSSSTRSTTLRRALVAQARAHVDTLMPGYTHLQRAQPVRLAHHLLAYDAMLDARSRPRRRRRAARRRIAARLGRARRDDAADRSRARRARARVLASVTRNSLDAVGDRDFAIELVAACALAQVHLSRLGEELVLWTSQEFGFVQIGEAYCSG